MLLPALILFQAICTVFFVVDVFEDIDVLGWSSLTDLHLLPEIGATIGLVTGIVVMTVYLLRVLRRQAHLERSLGWPRGRCRT